MRIERWYWLPIFCVISLGIHVGLAIKSGRWASAMPAVKMAEIEVALEPLAEPPKEPEKETPAPKPPPPPRNPEPKTEPAKVETPWNRPQQRQVATIKPVRGVPFDPAVKVMPKVVERIVPTAPNVDPGGFDPLREEKPLPSGLPSGRRDAGVPQLTRIARSELKPGGGGSPAPDPNFTGRDGAPGPEAPPEDILYAGGGAGGLELPREAPRMGGGGGASILSVNNPLAKDAIPEEKPGLGPGLGGAAGAGAGGGVGFSRDKGIGTRLDGGPPLATLRAKAGTGIGAGVGNKIGTNPPGGGKGTGAEMPGTGGTGLGYGRGSGIGVGNGSGVGVGDGAAGSPGKFRGVPFGDVAGILNGDPNGGGGKGGGPGGPGRGGVFGKLPGGGGGGPVHIVYVLDISGSMREQNKIGHAKAALKKALSELKPTDTFNVLNFARDVYAMEVEMLPATKANIQTALKHVDELDALSTNNLAAGTNIGAAMQVALSYPRITHVYLLSDGEPDRSGIQDFDELRTKVKQWNVDLDKNGRKCHINTLAIGMGEAFRGTRLLKGLAADNDGLYGYVDVTKIPDPDSN